MITSLMTRKLIVVTGKGGVGKSTIATSLGLLAARNGLRALVVEMGGQQIATGLFAVEAGVGETKLTENLWAITIDPDAALVEWLTAVGGSVPARLLTSRSSFRAFAAAAPGAKELVSLVKVWELTQSERWRKRGGRYDLVILDAPATGHALALVRSPATYGAIARVGPVAAQIRHVGDLLADRDRTGYVAVAQGSEMAITETLELAEGLERDMHRELDTVIVNGTFPRRFSSEELRRLATLESSGTVGSAARAALFVADRARLQHNQIARLRRQHLHVLAVPFIFQARLDPAALAQIADRLAAG